MKRFALASSMIVLVGGAVYACSDDPAPSNPGTDSGGADSPTGTDTGTGGDTSTGNDAGGDTNQPPTKCDYLEDAGTKNKPDLQPAACKECVAARCCAVTTACYGAAPADAGQDGGDGTKTSCMLYGECEEACVAAGGGAAQIEKCEIDCKTAYGQKAQTDWGAAGECVYEPDPKGCKNVCP